jgi:murein DD-endopeptidase MepM/ murein hydrolase activator NlpD
MFKVSLNTILMANDMKKGQKLKEGETLVILPISGSEHTVVKGQTLASIAKLYKLDIDEITSYNGIPDNAKLSVGDKILIPGGDTMINDDGGDKPAPNLGASVAKDTNYYLTHPLLNLVGFFINPVPTGHKTQGLHGPGHRGIDIGAPTGTAMYASAPGTVVATKTGCKVGRRSCGGGYGNFVIIEHANNTKTLYAHMSKVNTYAGDQVNRGEIIGTVGNTGRSTGPHIHFEVFNAKNPGVDWSWANNNSVAKVGSDSNQN